MSNDDDLPLPGPMPEPAVDPPEPAHPDDLDTITPGLTDESGILDDDRWRPQVEPTSAELAATGADEAADPDVPDVVAAEEPTA